MNPTRATSAFDGSDQNSSFYWRKRLSETHNRLMLGKRLDNSHLTVGMQVHHQIHGDGRVIEHDVDDQRGKPYHVLCNHPLHARTTLH